VSWCSTTWLFVNVEGRSVTCEDWPDPRPGSSTLEFSHGRVLSELLQGMKDSRRDVVALFIRHMVARLPWLF
jgi:hypothetical protein